MFQYSMEVNSKIGLKFISGFLILVLLIFLQEYPAALWTVKILVVIFQWIKWHSYIKKKSKVKFFEASFWCVGIYFASIVYVIFPNHKLGNGFAVLLVAIWISGMVVAARAGSSSWKIIKKYYPDVIREYESTKDCFEVFGNAQNLENKLLALKEEAPRAAAEAIMRWESVKVIPVFHLEMIFLSLVILIGTPYL